MALQNLKPSEFSSENIKQIICLFSAFWCPGIWSRSSWNNGGPFYPILSIPSLVAGDLATQWAMASAGMILS